MNILAGLIGRLIELLADEVGDGLDHLLLLALILPLAGSLDLLVYPDKVALLRVTSDVTEVLTNISLSIVITLKSYKPF